MKIIALWNNYGMPEAEATSEARPVTVWLSDSCLLREGRPFYVPDWDDDFRLFPSVAIRIDRLGKGIQPRFASRYWNSVSVWVNARACTLAAKLASQGLPLVSAVAFDMSLISAPFFEVIPEEFRNFEFEMSVNSECVCRWRADMLTKDVNEIISAISDNTTLKTGDILLLGFPKEGVKVRPGDRVELQTTNGQGEKAVINSFKIK
ncbi:MAG: fumarylacetoacetate hydrolase family protein [Prevotella sp.]|nr:fumarylacetoacetate hydrolase family protein [Prevotella sp.]MCM1075437.1 fumarylacetoacetate hydrolase family protein [Ruminococcus sp.]